MFKFTIRELLLLTVIVAMGVAWWVDRSRLAGMAILWQSRATKLTETYFEDGWKVIWEEDSDSGTMTWQSRH
ncbi:MAG TPA: hypothetical protein VFB96_18895 [Pirellulaceae bacterium]|nr:hypothetical protein [Pirellulaceae bacterium]